jgi:hypothetical protein
MKHLKVIVNNTLRRYGPNIIDTEQYKMHVLTREYQPGEWEILIETWTPEQGWATTQYLLAAAELKKFKAEIHK